MGRQKIAIEKLEPASQRRSTFKKRSGSIKKKAKELSIISDAQVLLLLRAPKGQYHLCHGENSTFDGILQKFLHETKENLDKSRLHSTEMLKKSYNYKSDSHALQAISLMDHGMCSTDKQQGSQEMHLEQMKLEVSKLESQLGPLRNIDDIEKFERLDELTMMENYIVELLSMNDQQARVESISTDVGYDPNFYLGPMGHVQS